MDSKDPPPYTEQPLPQAEVTVHSSTEPTKSAEPAMTTVPLPQPQPQSVVQSQPAGARAHIQFVPAANYQPPPHPYYPSSQPSYYTPIQQPMQPPSGATAVIINSTIKPHIPVGKDPTFIRCPTCQNDVITTIQSTPTGRTHLYALFLCLVGCWPCVCVPYCMDSCKATNHYCPVCNAFIGRRSM